MAIIKEGFGSIEKKAYNILKSWDKEDLINDIIGDMSKEDIRDFIRENED